MHVKGFDKHLSSVCLSFLDFLSFSSIISLILLIATFVFIVLAWHGSSVKVSTIPHA